jgi:hypothetical protein
MSLDPTALSRMQRYILRGTAAEGYFAPRGLRGFGTACRALERRGLVHVTTSGWPPKVVGVHLTTLGEDVAAQLPK